MLGGGARGASGGPPPSDRGDPRRAESAHWPARADARPEAGRRRVQRLPLPSARRRARPGAKTPSAPPPTCHPAVSRLPRCRAPRDGADLGCPTGAAGPARPGRSRSRGRRGQASGVMSGKLRRCRTRDCGGRSGAGTSATRCPGTGSASTASWRGGAPSPAGRSMATCSRRCATGRLEIGEGTLLEPHVWLTAPG